MAWVRSEAWGHDGLRTSPMPRRYCWTWMWWTTCNGPVAVIEITPRYWRPFAGSDVTPPPAGTAQRGRADVATGDAGGGGGGGGGGGAGRVVVVVTGFGGVVVDSSGLVVVVIGGAVVGGRCSTTGERETVAPEGRTADASAVVSG